MANVQPCTTGVGEHIQDVKLWPCRLPGRGRIDPVYLVIYPVLLPFGFYVCEIVFHFENKKL